MSSAFSGSRVSIWARMASLQGSAPKIPTRSEISSRATPASASASPSRAAYEGVQQRTSGWRSRSRVTWRWVWPPDTGTRVQPISSAPACIPSPPVKSP